MLDFAQLAQIAEQNIPAALCTVTETTGSTPRKAGSRMVVFDDGTSHGRIEGTLGGGAVEHRVRGEALKVIILGHPKQITVALTKDLGMCCGGQMSVFIEPLQPKPVCLILGAGHIAQSLCFFASRVGFWVVVADPRPDLLTTERFSNAKKLVPHYTSYDLDTLPFGPNLYVIVVTHDHQRDQQLVEEILKRSFHYGALVGSKRKATLTLERCVNKGFDIEQVKKIICPAGLLIGSETPDEIALAIAAQMVQVKNGMEMA